MNNKDLKVFILALIVLILSVSAVTAADDTTSDVTQDEIQTQNIQTSSVTAQKNIETTKLDKNVQAKESNIKKEGTTHIINNDTIDTFFVGENYGLSDEVVEGDTLDFQGNIFRNHSIRFNKAVNVVTSTNDAVICLNTTSGSLMGDAPGNSFIIDVNGSYSNFTGLYLNNTQFWVTHANNVNFYNMSMVVNDSRVGSGVGQTAIRDDSSYILLDNCFIYTRNNGGSSSFVITGATYCTIQNSIIQGAGNVGNLVYLNEFNSASGSAFNEHNRIINNIIIGPETVSSSCWCISIKGRNNEFINNTMNYAGTGVSNAFGSSSNTGNYFEGNEFNGGCGIGNIVNGTYINNTVNDNGVVTIAANSTYSDNTFAKVTFSGANTIFENNTVTGSTSVSTPVNFSHNNFADISLTNRASNSNITNNTINGTITVQATGVSIVENDIDSPGDYAIVSTAANTVIENNTIKTATRAGADALNVPATATVNGNTPEAGANFEITDETYPNFFDAEGNLINTAVTDYSTITLVGTFNNKSFNFKNIRLNVIGQEAKLKDATITVATDAIVDIKNIAIENGNMDTEAILLEGSSSKIRNCDITINSQNKGQAIVIKNDANTVSSNNITISTLSKDIDYLQNPAIADAAAIVVLSSGNTITQNNVSIMANEDSTSGTIEAITLQGTDENSVDNNNVSSNTIVVVGPAYVYGITSTVNVNKNTFDKNKITLASDSYAAGIQLMGAPIVSDTVSSNTINITAVNDAYGIIINGWDDKEITKNNVSKNTINAIAKNVFLVEVAGSYISPVTSSYIESNNLYASGDYVTAIAASGEGLKINSNNININGTSNDTVDTWDVIKPTTAGINILDSQSITALSNKINVTNGPAIKLTNVKDSALNSSTIRNNNTAIVLVNSQANTFKSNDVITTSTYTTTLENSTSNTITNNKFNANNVLGGDDSVSCDESSTDNIIESNTPIIRVLTQDTYDTYFDEESNLRDLNINILSLGSDLTGKDLTFNKGINFTNLADYTIYNGTIKVTGPNNTVVNFTYININNVDKPAYITDFQHNNQKNIAIDHNTITITGDDITVIDVKAVNTGYSYLSVNNSNINVEANKVKVIDYLGYDRTTSINGVCEMKNTNVTVKAQESAVVMDVKGGIPYFNTKNNVNIEAQEAIALRANRSHLNYANGFQSNVINIDAADAKALVVIDKIATSTDTIAYNNITISSQNPVTAISVQNFSRLTFQDNVIICNSTNGETPVISIVDSSTVTVKNNYIEALDVAGNAAVSGATTNTQNKPEEGSYKVTIEADFDDVEVVQYRNVEVPVTVVDTFGNPVEGVITLTVSGVEFTAENGVVVFNTPECGSVDAVVKYVDPNGHYNTTSVTKTLDVEEAITTVTVDSVVVDSGVATITASVVDQDGVGVDGGRVYFKVNGKIIRDAATGKIVYADVADGIASITTDVAKGWGDETPVMAVYSGTGIAPSASSEVVDMNFSETTADEPQIVLDDVSATAGETVSITVKVENIDDLNAGKVVLKVNGKTVKGNDGKLYAKLVNGEAVFSYTVPKTLKAGSYDIKAVYTNGATKLEQESTLTIA